MSFEFKKVKGRDLGYIMSNDRVKNIINENKNIDQNKNGSV